MKLNEKTLPEFKPTQDMVHAAKAVFVCMAIEQTIRPIVTGYQKAILEKGQYHIAKKWIDRRGEPDRIITEPNQSYLLEDDDFGHYLTECNQARIVAKLHVENDEFCPLLVAQENVRKAEKLLIDVMEPITHITNKNLNRHSLSGNTIIHYFLTILSESKFL